MFDSYTEKNMFCMACWYLFTLSKLDVIRAFKDTHRLVGLNVDLLNFQAEWNYIETIE